MTTEDLSYPQLKVIALGTEKMLDLYRWDPLMTVSEQCSVKLCRQPVGSSFSSQITPSKAKKTKQESSSFSSEEKTTMSCQSLTWVSNRNTQSQQEKKNNYVFLFFSFHQLQKTGKTKTNFSVKSRQTKLRVFIVVRKPSDHTLLIYI